MIWSYLFPLGARFERVDKSASEAQPNDAKTILVGGERELAARDISSAAGLVVINPDRALDARMRTRGFAYVRRFAMLPNKGDARWLIPLDSGAVAAGASRLHPPFRPIPRAKFALARTAVASGLPFVPATRVAVVQRTDPPLEGLLIGLFRTATRIGFSSGTPGGLPKPSFVVVSGSGAPLAFGKIAETPFRRQALENEARALSHLSTQDKVRGSIPSMIFAGELEGRFITLQRPLEGAPGPRAFGTAHRRFLERLLTGETRPVASSEFILSIAKRIEAYGRRPKELQMWQRFRAALEDVELPAVNNHGDFAPWNLKAASGDVGAFDWEWWSPHGLPLVDEIHHRLQVGFLLDRWTSDRGFAELTTLATSRPFGLERGPAHALLGVGLLDYFLRIIEDGYPEQGSLAVRYGELLVRMLSCLGGSNER